MTETNEMYLLEWLLRGEGQYGECRGQTLDAVLDKGWVEIRPGREHQSGFIAKGDGIDYQAVFITDAGRAALARGEKP